MIFSPSPEICTRIVQHSKKEAYHPLSLVSKSFNRPAEAFLYHSAVLYDISTNTRFWQTMLTVPRLAALVRSVQIYFYRGAALPSTPAFWELIQAGLSTVKPYLQSLYIEDPACLNSFILNDARSLRVASPMHICTVNFRYTADVALFLSSTPHVRDLRIGEPMFWEVVHPLPKMPQLPELQKFHGSATLVLDHLLNSPTPPPLTHLCLVVDPATVSSREGEQSIAPRLKQLLPRLSCISNTLRSITFVNLADSFFHLRILSTIVECCPRIRHIGGLKFEYDKLPLVCELLAELPILRTLEVDFTKWRPVPDTQPTQRFIITNVATFVPTLQGINVLIPGTATWWARGKPHHPETVVPSLKGSNGAQESSLDNAVKEGSDWSIRPKNGFPQECVWRWA